MRDGMCGSCGPAPMMPQGYQSAMEFRGLSGAGLGDIQADLLAAGGPGLVAAAGASIAGSALGGALLGGAASGTGTGAGTGALLSAGMTATAQGLIWVVVGRRGEASTLTAIGALETLVGLGMLVSGGMRAKRSISAGRPMAGRR